MNPPDSNPKTRFGVRKPGIADIPPSAILHLGQAMSDGERKYGRTNWRENEVTASVYYNAAARHLMAWWDGEQVAPDSGVHHLGHVMACCAILLDAEASGQIIDDRPSVPGPFARLVAELTEPEESEQPDDLEIAPGVRVSVYCPDHDTYFDFVPMDFGPA
jgi:dATP/dGTP diphosphohydrolase